MSKIAELTERRLWQLVCEARALAVWLREQYEAAGKDMRGLLGGWLRSDGAPDADALNRYDRLGKLWQAARERQGRRVAAWEGYMRMGPEAQAVASTELGAHLASLADEAQALVDGLALAHWRLQPKNARDGIKKSRILRLHNLASGRQMRRIRRYRAWVLLHDRGLI